jgi:hypothetical protein
VDGRTKNAFACSTPGGGEILCSVLEDTAAAASTSAPFLYASQRRLAIVLKDQFEGAAAVAVKIEVLISEVHRQVRERYIESKSKFLPLRNAWIKNSKAVAIAEFEEEQATQYAGV